MDEPREVEVFAVVPNGAVNAVRSVSDFRPGVQHADHPSGSESYPGPSETRTFAEYVEQEGLTVLDDLGGLQTEEMRRIAADADALAAVIDD
jgi:hypothetical protein